jgi:hypothetical protein
MSSLVKSIILVLVAAMASPGYLCGQDKFLWRAATSKELESVLPTRAPVVKERIETEMRTASGIIDPSGRIIAGVVLITAGYSAEGKYSHYLLVQAPITVAGISLPAGQYVFGWQRVNDGLEMRFYDAATGIERGEAVAHHVPPGTPVESFRLWPPAEHTWLQIGRFALPYSVKE